jgi:hypothetical protein
VNAVKDTDGEAGHAGMRVDLAEGNGADEHRFLISHKKSQRKQRGGEEKEDYFLRFLR